MGILVMSIPFDCSLLVSLFFHLEPICEPKYGQLKTDPARSPLPVTQPQLHIQVSLCQSMNLIWTHHEFDKSNKVKWLICISTLFIIFFPTKFTVGFGLLKMDFRLKMKANKNGDITLFHQKDTFLRGSKWAACLLKFFKIRK